jgi:hypothetical protein
MQTQLAAEGRIHLIALKSQALCSSQLQNSRKLSVDERYARLVMSRICMHASPSLLFVDLA